MEKGHLISNMLTKKNRLLIGVVVALLVGTAVIIASCSSEPPMTQWDITCEDDLLQKLETGDKEFIKREGIDNIIYWHQRMIDEAFVEFDNIQYVFDKNTKELIEKDVHWRDDLPEHLPPIISREEAESMVEGKTDSASLYYISPESDVFPIKPTPKNPCWVVDDKRVSTHVPFGSRSNQKSSGSSFKTLKVPSSPAAAVISCVISTKKSLSSLLSSKVRSFFSFSSSASGSGILPVLLSTYLKATGRSNPSNILTFSDAITMYTESGSVCASGETSL